MTDRDSLHERGRALEEEYFRKKDRELIEKMQRAALEDQARRDLTEKTGLRDPELLKELQDLGFTPDTVGLLPLMPVLQVAWAEGDVSAGERAALVKLARARGITDGSAADRQLAAWMSTRPAETVFVSATRLIRAMLADEGRDQTGMNADDLVKYCEEIAAASGGIFGINRVSSEERALLTSIAAALKGKN
jgi:ADP-ribose pyrophosphatase YjhB (NUDIX family)